MKLTDLEIEDIIYVLRMNEADTKVVPNEVWIERRKVLINKLVDESYKRNSSRIRRTLAWFDDTLLGRIIVLGLLYTFISIMLSLMWR